MTAEQLFELPDDGDRSELVQGEIVRMNPAGGRRTMCKCSETTTS